MQFWLRYTLSTRWRRRIPLLGQGFGKSKQLAELRRFKPGTRIEELANGSSWNVVSQHPQHPRAHCLSTFLLSNTSKMDIIGWNIIDAPDYGGEVQAALPYIP